MSTKYGASTAKDNKAPLPIGANLVFTGPNADGEKKQHTLSYTVLTHFYDPSEGFTVQELIQTGGKCYCGEQAFIGVEESAPPQKGTNQSSKKKQPIERLQIRCQKFHDKMQEFKASKNRLANDSSPSMKAQPNETSASAIELYNAAMGENLSNQHEDEDDEDEEAIQSMGVQPSKMFRMGNLKEPTVMSEGYGAWGCGMSITVMDRTKLPKEWFVTDVSCGQACFLVMLPIRICFTHSRVRTRTTAMGTTIRDNCGTQCQNITGSFNLLASETLDITPEQLKPLLSINGCEPKDRQTFMRQFALNWSTQVHSAADARELLNELKPLEPTPSVSMKRLSSTLKRKLQEKMGKSKSKKMKPPTDDEEED
jgi:hypothetical protein